MVTIRMSTSNQMFFYLLTYTKKKVSSSALSSTLLFEKLELKVRTFTFIFQRNQIRRIFLVELFPSNIVIHQILNLLLRFSPYGPNEDLDFEMTLYYGFGCKKIFSTFLYLNSKDLDVIVKFVV